MASADRDVVSGCLANQVMYLVALQIFFWHTLGAHSSATEKSVDRNVGAYRGCMLRYLDDRHTVPHPCSDQKFGEYWLCDILHFSYARKPAVLRQLGGGAP
jgi:hypothetical protein